MYIAYPGKIQLLEKFLPEYRSSSLNLTRQNALREPLPCYCGPMPCDDIREHIQIRLDDDDRLVEYSLLKNTCGAPVGHAALLLEVLKGAPADHILHQDENTWLPPGVELNEDELFLYYKHLFALRATLHAAFGLTRGGPEDVCALASMGCDINGAYIEGVISVEALTQEIKSCGNCKTCRT